MDKPIDFSQLDAAEQAYQQTLARVEAASNPISRLVFRAKAWVEKGEVVHQTDEHEGMVDEIARLQALSEE